MVSFEIEKIGSIRRQLGLTQTELAKLAGVSQSLIAKIESGRIDPAYSKAKQILDALENEISKSKGVKSAKEIMCTHVLFLGPDDKLSKAMRFMREKGFSQIPVFDGNTNVGSISDDLLIDIVSKHGKDAGNIKVKDIMREGFPILPENANLDSVTGLLRFYKAVLIKNDAKFIGIITKADLIKAIK
jgi:predicted transcriptional regulator